MQVPVPAPRFFSWSFRSLVLVGIVALVLVAMGLLVVMLGYEEKKLTEDLAQTMTVQKLQHVRARVDELLSAAERQAEICVRLTPQGGPRSSEFVRVFSLLAPTFVQRPEFTYLGFGLEETGEYAMLERLGGTEYRLREYVILPGGSRVIRDYRPTGAGFELAGVQPWDDYDPRARPFYEAAKKNRKAVWTQSYVFRGNDRRGEIPGVSFGLPVYGETGLLRGVWDVDFDTYALSDFLKTQASESAGYAFVVEQLPDKGWNLIAHPGFMDGLGRDGKLAAVNASPLDPVVGSLLRSVENVSLFTERQHRFQNGEESFVASYEMLPTERAPSWLLAVVLPESYVESRLAPSRRMALVLVIGVTVAAVLLAIWLSKMLAGPVERLRSAVDGMADATDMQSVPVGGPFELSRLAATFNRMAASVDSRRRELLAANLRLQEEVRQRRQREAELEAVIMNAPVDIWAVDMSGRYTLMGRHLQERFGDVVGRLPAELNLPEAIREEYARNNLRALSGEVLRGETTEISGGRQSHYHWIITPIRTNGLITGALGVGIDVTERRRAEDALLRSQQRLRLHLENTPLAVIDWSLDFNVISWNPAAEAVFGWRAEDALGRNGLFLVPESERPAIRQVWTELLQRNGGYRSYNKNVTRDGRVIDCEWYNTVLTDDDERVIGVSSLVLDVSQRISAEAMFREAEERFFRSFRSSPVAKCVVSPSGCRIIDANERFAQMLDFQREDLVGRSLFDLSFSENSPGRAQIATALEKESEVLDIEYRLRPRTGGPVDVMLSASPLPLGEEICLLVTTVDITERKVAEKALRESQQFLAALIGHLPGMVYRCANDRNWTMTFVSDGARELTGYSPAELEHSRIIDFGSLIHPEDRARVWDETQAAFASGKVAFTYEYRLIRRSGDVRWVWEKGEGQFNERREVTSLVGFITDITERKRAEEEVLMLNLSLERRVVERTAELAEANEKLKELDRLKSEFLATMSHELRTPLNSIIGFSSILAQGMVGPLNAEQKKQIGMVNGSARHLLGLINDLLDLSRIESGRMEIYPEEFLIDDVLREIESTLAPMVEQKQLTYASDTKSKDLRLVSDRKRVFQVVLNLAGNAVKFTQQGGVRVYCAKENGGLKIDVIDTGPGIRPEHIDMLFEAFRQIDGSARRVYEGTGLGLHLCRKLLDLLGGHIEVQSTYGKGSCFSVWLPRTVSKQEGLPP